MRSYRHLAAAMACSLCLWGSQAQAAEGRFSDLNSMSFHQQEGAQVRLSDPGDDPLKLSDLPAAEPSRLSGTMTGNAACSSSSCGCGSGCHSGHEPCCLRWLEMETLLWWTKGRSLPPLITTSPDGTPIAQAGVLPEATVLFGNEEVQDLRAGGRFTFGQWLRDGYAVGGRVYFLEREGVDFQQSSTGSPILARPFINVPPGQEDASLIAFPNVWSGNIDARSTNDLVGTEIFVRQNIRSGCGYRIDSIGGYLFTRIDDSLVIRSQSVSQDATATSLPVGTVIDALDDFDTENQFHGGQAGFLLEFYRGCWSVDVLAKVAFGNMRTKAFVDGSTVTTEPGGNTAQFVGGLLTQASNIGLREDDELAYIPELNVNVNYSLSERMDVGLGYTFIYYSDVVLAGNQVDRRINLTQQQNGLVGERTPLPPLNNTDFWAQGLSFSFSYGY